MRQDMLTHDRGNWRKESKSAPSLLTKSCHDIDFLMWLLCSPGPNAPVAAPHLPAYVSSTGSLKFYRKERKPLEAGQATNCLQCPHEKDCSYSSKKIYLDRLQQGQLGWPVCIVNPEMEDLFQTKGREAAAERLLQDLGEDYTAETPSSQVEARPWYGRCVWESDNDVVDDQCVTMTWDDDAVEHDMKGGPILHGRGAKTAQFHMVAFTEQICQRRGRIYGTKGEIEYDSRTITVHDFATGSRTAHRPHLDAGAGHGGGDIGLVRQFLKAVAAVDGEEMGAAEAQRTFLGCDVEEAFRSHAMVFAAEEARTSRQVVDWKTWWSLRVESQLHAHAA
jgi:predicted dehydrogenase